MSEPIEYDQLPHADDYPDATVRDPELEITPEGLAYLKELEDYLTKKYESPEVQEYVAKVVNLQQ